jgi:hypothetical protein
LISSYHPLSINTLTEKEKACIGALMHTSLFKKNITIDLTEGISLELAPTQEYRKRIIIKLLNRSILKPANAYYRKRIFLPRSYMRIVYEINIQDIKTLLPLLMYPRKIGAGKEQEILPLLLEIRLHEAIEYMYETLRQFHMRLFLCDPRYIQLFLQILKTYSLGQVFNFIYTAIRDQAAYMQRDSGTYVPLENYIYKKIVDRYERAESEGWTIIHFNRAWGWQQSELSKLVCGRLLDINDSIIHEVIDDHYTV